MPSSIDFYKRIFLHVIPARIVVPCSNQPFLNFFGDSKNNPADMLILPKAYENFEKNRFWWKGATFLIGY